MLHILAVRKIITLLPTEYHALLRATMQKRQLMTCPWN